MLAFLCSGSCCKVSGIGLGVCGFRFGYRSETLRNEVFRDSNLEIRVWGQLYQEQHLKLSSGLKVWELGLGQKAKGCC